MNSGAERFNGLMAMLGIVAGIGAYATTVSYTHLTLPTKRIV